MDDFITGLGVVEDDTKGVRFISVYRDVHGIPTCMSSNARYLIADILNQWASYELTPIVVKLAVKNIGWFKMPHTNSFICREDQISLFVNNPIEAYALLYG